MSAEIFEQFSPSDIEDVFIYYDIPRTFVIRDNKRNPWLFSWICDNNNYEFEDIKRAYLKIDEVISIGHHVDFWIGFQISENRLLELRS